MTIPRSTQLLATSGSKKLVGRVQDEGRKKIENKNGFS